MFFIAVIVGALVTALLVNNLKRDVQKFDVYETKEVLETQEVPQKTNQKEVNKTANAEIKKLTDITSIELIDINLAGSTCDDVIDEMIQKLDDAGALSSTSEFKQSIIKFPKSRIIQQN